MPDVVRGPSSSLAAVQCSGRGGALSHGYSGLSVAEFARRMWKVVRRRGGPIVYANSLYGRFLRRYLHTAELHGSVVKLNYALCVERKPTRGPGGDEADETFVFMSCPACRVPVWRSCGRNRDTVATTRDGMLTVLTEIGRVRDRHRPVNRGGPKVSLW